MQKMTPKNQITIEIFRMLKFDDFIMYSSYTTKMFIKKHGSFGSKLCSWEISIFGVQVSPLGVIFSMVEVFSIFVLVLMGTLYAHRIYS